MCCDLTGCCPASCVIDFRHTLTTHQLTHPSVDVVRDFQKWHQTDLPPICSICTITISSLSSSVQNQRLIYSQYLHARTITSATTETVIMAGPDLMYEDRKIAYPLEQTQHYRQRYKFQYVFNEDVSINLIVFEPWSSFAPSLS